ncbi:hypothetical protein HGG73_17935 [Rhodobacteraceae bacterium R_SAG3]|nr:hypothetical protein [Rhodobacteraceae bacterium R_SAG3]
MRYTLIILRCVLLAALVFAGTVPVGMMRVSAQNGEGIRLVLCTDEGTREVWMREDGTIAETSETQEGERHSKHGAPHCVQVSLFAPDWSLPTPSPFSEGFVSAVLSSQTDQISCPAYAGRAHLCPAPPSSV